MPPIVTIEIDLAKNVLVVHGADDTGKRALVHPSVRRAKLAELMVSLPPYLIVVDKISTYIICCPARKANNQT